MKQTTLFVDTSIFRGAGFNFKARTMNALIEVAQRNSLKLLLPEITEKEIIRQISALSEEVSISLKASKKKAFMLVRHKPWVFNVGTDELENEIRRLLKEDWEAFQSSFNVEKLPYSDINLQKVLEWWEVHATPFSKKKNTEFADAFSATCLLKYQLSNKCSISVISTDSDWRSFCEEHKNFTFYNSTMSFAESLNPDVESILLIKSIVEKSEEVATTIKNKITNSSFNITIGFDSIIHSKKVRDVGFTSLNVLNSSFDNALITFDCSVGLTLALEYSDIFDEERIETDYGSCVNTSGTITARIDPVERKVIDLQVDFDDNGEFSFP